MQKSAIIAAVVFLVSGSTFVCSAPPETPEDLARNAQIAEFTRKMEEANYPVLFEKAAREFNVPVQILEGISFAETRWEHLTWPEGETKSPEDGMPRPYGIMSLWDNDFFGHNLIEAARLIGKSPEDLKRDPLDNMRGAAAYLHQLYDSTPKPDGTSSADLESWRNAIANYTGIPEPDLKQEHALSVYEYLGQGFHGYGIKLDAVPDLKLEPMRVEVKKIRDEEARKRVQTYAAESPLDVQAQPSSTPLVSETVSPSTTNAVTNTATDVTAQPQSHRWMMGWLLIGLVAIGVIFILRQRPSGK